MLCILLTQSRALLSIKRTFVRIKLFIVLLLSLMEFRLKTSECRVLGIYQEAYKGEIQCLTLPNQICLLTNHNKFHATDIQLLLLSSNQNTVFHRK